MHELGHIIYEKRAAFLKEFIPIFQSRYEVISNGKEPVDLIYKSQLQAKEFLTLLTENIGKDRMTQYTNYGIHKDDLGFEIDGHPVKKFGSQGQQKSFLIALKLAQFDFIKALSKVNPILLLDDIFDKLDEDRVAQIITLVDQENFGQLFITDTHENRTEAVVKKIHQSYKMFGL
jgi:DNA replication and repair protein RecF